MTTAAILALPALAASGLISLGALLITVATRTRSALLAGTVAAFAGGVAGLLAVLILLTPD